MKSVFVVCVFALIASIACQEYFVTGIYSDSGCKTAIGRRATSFFQPTQNCSTTIMNPTCTQTGTNYIMEQCTTTPDLNPEPSWITIAFYDTESCANTYAIYTGVPDKCTYYDFSNTWTLSSCDSGNNIVFKEGSTGCDYTSGTTRTVGSACVNGGGIGIRGFCPDQFGPVSAGTPGSNTPTGTNSPTGSNTPTSGSTPSAATPAKKSSAGAATLAATVLIFAAVVAF